MVLKKNINKWKNCYNVKYVRVNTQNKKIYGDLIVVIILVKSVVVL